LKYLFNERIPASGTPYVTKYFPVVIVEGVEAGGQNTPMIPALLPPDETPVIVTWRQSIDLDAHVTEPTPEGLPQKR